MKNKNSTVSSNLVTYFDKTSIISEAYRSLSTNIQYTSVDEEVKSILITSSSIKEGKTVTACNLAIVMANTEKRVLLLDADLRKPNIHNQFKILNHIGLTNILLSENSIEESIKKNDDIKNLDIITSGILPPNPLEIVASKKMKQFLHDVTKIYDIIIIDSPPIGYVSDALILSGYVDGVILTVAIKETNIGQAYNAVKQLKNVKANILGSVVTKKEKKLHKQYYYN